ncbi:MAG: RIP metalloprotease RseP [Planctomycetota bacterium]|nr:RIP metalloprotease RseP [Planctomycetota bacterium]
MDDLLLNIYRWALVAFGIGLVIFVHELGHFLAARWCKVRVETFSLGFGPKLLGWKRGPTTYQIAAVPLGGYVKMAGEEGPSDGGAPASDELPGKSVGQRFLIYSGGVLMNVAFALVVFPIILSVGVPFSEPIVGSTTPGSPAWHAGLQSGTRVESVNGNVVYSFLNIPNEVALGSPEETVLVVRDPGATNTRTVRLVPQWNEAIGAYSIGVNPAADAHGSIAVEKGSSAEKAGLVDGDRLVDVAGTSPGLTLDERLAKAARNGDVVRATFERGGRTFAADIVPTPDPKLETQLLGVGPLVRRVVAVRDTPLARRSGLAKDDRILDADGMPLVRPYDFLERLEAARGPVSLRVERGGSALALTIPALAAGEAVQLAQDVAIGQDADSTLVAITPGSAAADAGLRDGDRIQRIDGKEVSTFADVQSAAKEAGKDKQKVLALDVVRGTETLTVRVAPRAWRAPTYGFGVRDAQYVFRSDGPLDAVHAGFGLSWKFLEESWLTLKRILFRQVSGQNIGGIITIGVVSHSFVSDGIAKLFYFLCMLSMNLAFLNVLPIPVLDGGHLLFLGIEKLKGSPVSERIHGYSQLVGVVLIVSLMVYVTFNDVVRWIVR